MLYNTGITTKSNTTKEYMQVDVKSASKVTSLLINNYASVVTPVREAIVNGLEAIEGTQDGVVTVTLKSELMTDSDKIFGSNSSDNSYSVIIEDNGIGMSHDFVVNRYLKLTNSTKDDDVNAIGGFGIGAKAIMSISNHTVIRTVKDGEATVVVLGIDSHGVTQEVSQPIAVDEPNGTRVSASISYPTYKTIKENLGKEFLNYLDEDSPVVVVEGNDMGTSVIDYDNVMESRNNIKTVTTSSGIVVHFQRNDNNNDNGWWNRNNHKDSFSVRVAGMPYPVSSHMAEELHDVCDDLSSSFFGSVNPVYNERKIVLDIPACDVVVSSSRESIVDTPETMNLVTSSYREAMETIISEIDTGMKNARNINDFQEIVDSANNLLRANTYSFSNFISDVAKVATDYQGKTITIVPDTQKGGALNNHYNTIFRCSPMTIDGMFSFFGGTYVDSIERLRDNSDSVESFVKADMQGASALLVAKENNSVGRYGVTNGDVLPDSAKAILGDEQWNEIATVGVFIRALLEWSGITVIEHERTWKSLRASMMSRGRNIGKSTPTVKRSYGNRANDYRFHIIDEANDEILSGSRSDLGDIVDHINNSGSSVVFVENISDTTNAINKNGYSYGHGYNWFTSNTTISGLCDAIYLLIGTPRGDVFDRDVNMLRGRVNDGVDIINVTNCSLHNMVSECLIGDIEGGTECENRYFASARVSNLSYADVSSHIHLNEASLLMVGDTGISLIHTLADYFGDNRNALDAVIDTKCKVMATIQGDNISDYTTLNRDTRYSLYGIRTFFSGIIEGHRNSNSADAIALESSVAMTRNILYNSDTDTLSAKQLEKALVFIFETAKNLRSNALVNELLNMKAK